MHMLAGSQAKGVFRGIARQGGGQPALPGEESWVQAAVKVYDVKVMLDELVDGEAKDKAKKRLKAVMKEAQVIRK